MNIDERTDELERRVLHLEQLLGGIRIAAGILGITSIGLIGYVVFITTKAGNLSDEIEQSGKDAISALANAASEKGYLGSENVVMGIVGMNGEPVTGTGFTSKRTEVGAYEVGTYEVVFDTPFQDRPTLLLSAGNLKVEGLDTRDYAFDNNAGFLNLDQNGFKVHTSDTGRIRQQGVFNAPEDSFVSFIAIGTPRQ